MSIGKRRPKIPRAQFGPSLPLPEAGPPGPPAGPAGGPLARRGGGAGDGRDRPRPRPPLHLPAGPGPEREIRVKVKEFHIRNQTKTSNERQAAADLVHPSMVNDPAPIKDLADRLDDLTVTIAKSARFEDLPEPVRNSGSSSPRPSWTSRRRPTRPQRRDNLHSQIDTAFAPLIANGVLGPDALPRNEESSRTLSIHTAEQPRAEARVVPRERVVPERIVKPGGPVSREFVSAFTTPRIGETLFQLVADRIDGIPP